MRGKSPIFAAGYLLVGMTVGAGSTQAAKPECSHCVRWTGPAYYASGPESFLQKPNLYAGPFSRARDCEARIASNAKQQMLADVSCEDYASDPLGDSGGN
jgi:hypothetical protein